MSIHQEETLSQQLSRILQRNILQGAISPGQKLTSQRQLATEHQLSRATVREAIQDLQSKGLVETYHGGGTVCRNLLEPMFDWPQEHNVDDIQLQKQVMEMRAALEGEAAFYAALRATEQHLDRIGLEYQEMQTRNNGNTTLTKAKADLNFHMLIAEASHNFFVMSFSQIFYNRYFNAIYAVLDRTLKKFGRYPDSIAAQHSKIYQEIINRDPQAAKAAAIEHINFTRELLEETE